MTGRVLHLTPPMPVAVVTAAVVRAASEAAPADLPALLGALEQAKATAWARQLAAPAAPPRTDAAEGDRLIDVTEAARLLGCSKDHLYRTANNYPFVLREGRAVRFSLRGLQAWITRHQGP